MKNHISSLLTNATYLKVDSKYVYFYMHAFIRFAEGKYPPDESVIVILLGM